MASDDSGFATLVVFSSAAGKKAVENLDLEATDEAEDSREAAFGSRRSKGLFKTRAVFAGGPVEGRASVAGSMETCTGSTTRRAAPRAKKPRKKNRFSCAVDHRDARGLGASCPSAMPEPLERLRIARGFACKTERAARDPSSCPWKKPSMTFFHLSDTPKSRGFWESPIAASCGGRLFPQPASGLVQRKRS